MAMMGVCGTSQSKLTTDGRFSTNKADLENDSQALRPSWAAFVSFLCHSGMTINDHIQQLLQIRPTIRDLLFPDF